MEYKGQKSSPFIVDILHQHGIDHVVICPGSRNAPLTLAFARHGKFNCLSIVDERSAGYFALGLAQALKKPVVLVCTSGTAPLNFAPAVAEAFYQQIPLVVLTADRPEAWIHQQDGQAIDQKNMYANIIARSYHLRGELYCDDDRWHTEKVTNEAVHISIAQSRPVHINISFAEPLYADSFENVNARKIAHYYPPASFNNWSASDWSALLKDKKNILLVLGQSGGHEALPFLARDLNKHSNVVIVAENLANLPADCYVSNATEAICQASDNMKPEVIIYAGGPLVSKQLKKYITALNIPVIRIQQNLEEVDTFQNNVALVQIPWVEAFHSLLDYLDDRNVSSSFSSAWELASEKAKKLRDEFLSQVPFCDLKVFEWISKNLSSGLTLHLGNSTPVRYAQLFNDHYAEGCTFYSNRGTSGIDGSVSTAAGFSYHSAATHVLITGDLSFQYDANAFFNKYVKGNMKVVVINNSGGNIFRVIDGPREQKERGDFFETSVQHEFSNLAKHFNLNYFSAKNEKELGGVWAGFMKANDRPSILEVFTDAEISANAFKEFYKKLQLSNEKA